MYIVAPLRHSNGKNLILSGFIVCLPGRELLAILEQWPGVTRNGESALIEKRQDHVLFRC